MGESVKLLKGHGQPPLCETTSVWKEIAVHLAMIQILTLTSACRENAVPVFAVVDFRKGYCIGGPSLGAAFSSGDNTASFEVMEAAQSQQRAVIRRKEATVILRSTFPILAHPHSVALRSCKVVNLEVLSLVWGGRVSVVVGTFLAYTTVFGGRRWVVQV
ncbi:hypothetical protein M8818_005056 [Zalaria obscura]|uniref:Uncharacterized protein n=1 Tax=Zalaria obscura TaxID=2024903 RepID=A0ACC3S9Z5_9PEZI